MDKIGGLYLKGIQPRKRKPNMHFYTMTIIEETNSECKSELKLWENTDGKIWVQIGYDDTDPYSTQGIAITLDDAQALINELHRLIEKMEPIEESQRGSKPGKQLSITPEQAISKVNWSK